MLRPGEVAGILRAHLKLPSRVDIEQGQPGVLSLPKTKTAARGARLQSVVIRDPILLLALHHVLGQLPSRALLCPGGVQGFASRLDVFLDALHIKSWFSAGGLRGGGAISFFLRTPNLAELQFAGRWEAASSLRHYLQHGLSVETWLDLDDASRNKVQFWAALRTALAQEIEIM